METSNIYETHPSVLGAAASVMIVGRVGAAAIGGHWTPDLADRDQPTSFYHLGVTVLGLLAGKFWLDSIGPRTFAGTLFGFSLLLH